MNCEELCQQHPVEQIVSEGLDDQLRKAISNSASNRCFVQQKLYKIYFKPEGISYEDSKLKLLNEYIVFIESWTLKDHNEAVKLIKLAKGINEFKAYLQTMYIHQGYCSRPDCWRKYYQQIIAHYESTGFLRELATDI